MTLTVGNFYEINYGSTQKAATYLGYDNDDSVHMFFDGSGVTGKFGFSDRFIASGKVEISELNQG